MTVIGFMVSFMLSHSLPDEIALHRPSPPLGKNPTVIALCPEAVVLSCLCCHKHGFAFFSGGQGQTGVRSYFMPFPLVSLARLC